MQLTTSTLSVARSSAWIHVPRIWIVYLALAAPGCVAYFLVQESIQALLYIAFALGAALAIVVGIGINQPVHRLPWYVLAAAVLSSAIGDVTYIYYELVLGITAPWPALPDAFYLTYYGLAALALFMLMRDGGSQDLGGMIDAGIVTASAALLSWPFLIAPYLNDGSMPLWHIAVAVSYPLMDILILAMLTRLAFTSSARVPTFYLLVFGVAVYVVADAVYGVQVLEDTYQGGQLVDLGWLVGYAALGAAALHPSMRRFPEGAAPRRLGLSWGRLALLAGIPIASLSVLALHGLLTGTTPSALVVPGVIGLFLLAVSRMGFVARDVTTANADIRRSEERYQMISRATADVIWDWDLRTDTVEWGNAIHTRFGYSKESVETTAAWWKSLVHPEDARRVHRLLRDALAGGQETWASEHRMRRADGSYAHVIDRGLIVRAANGEPVRMVGSVADISERKTLETQLEYQALHDALTGLPNRVLFTEQLNHALALATRRDQLAAVCFLDLDDFKVVNDSLGHDAGDRLVIEVANRLRSSLREADIVARFGGDEFALLLDHLDGRDEATRIIHRLIARLSAPVVIEGHTLYPTASVGVTFADARVVAASQLIRQADVAMYEAKRGGKARYALFEPQMEDRAYQRMALEAELRAAMEQSQFRVVYQPIVDLATGTIREVEALIRWQHPTRGLLGPAAFLPVADETGLILPIGRWVLREACRQTHAWQLTHPDYADLIVSVNISPRELHDQSLAQAVAGVLAETGLAPHHLQLEVAESAMLADIEQAVEALRELTELGVRLAIDDFGTGNSSLGHLRRLPVHTLKIDRSYVAELDKTEQGTTMVRAMVTLAKTLGMDVTAEGIETFEQTRLLEFGCDLGQGYHFARPLPAGELGELLDTDIHFGTIGQHATIPQYVLAIAAGLG